MKLPFIFGGVQRHCNIYIDTSQQPYLIFTLLHDQDIVKEFGDELTITTDFEKQLFQISDDTLVKELKEAIFQSIKIHPTFIARRNKFKSDSVHS